MAKDKSNAKGKAKGDKKGKKGKGAADGISVAGHPRAAAQVRRAKGFGGVTFFLITAYFSFKAQVPADQVALRALIARHRRIPAGLDVRGDRLAPAGPGRIARGARERPGADGAGHSRRRERRGA